MDFFLGDIFSPGDLTSLARLLRLKMLSLLQLMPHSRRFARRRRRLTPILGVIDKMIALLRASTHTHSRRNVEENLMPWLVPRKLAQEMEMDGVCARKYTYGHISFPCYRAVPANDVIVSNERISTLGNDIVLYPATSITVIVLIPFPGMCTRLN